MSVYCFFKDFAGPISTTLAAAAAASITYIFARKQARTAEIQAKIALEKLKYDTLSQRLDVVDAVEEMIAASINTSDGQLADTQKLILIRARVKRASFYFPPEVIVYLSNIVNKCFDAAQYQPTKPIAERRAWDEGNRASYEAEIKERLEARRYLSKEGNKIPELLRPHIAVDLFQDTRLAPSAQHEARIRKLTRGTISILVLIFFLASAAVISRLA
ncbi:hypothetical protein [Methylobacterium sp. Leaf118]|uniref:hypothetical protein n=1 Tax=Methylobacterium sp. Leaf118 TaxID=2876562 RepID=UPI001E39B0B2|nr:hypothetical protein [Methylobacterium sp. Leaf118]